MIESMKRNPAKKDQTAQKDINGYTNRSGYQVESPDMRIQTEQKDINGYTNRSGYQVESPAKKHQIS